MRLDSLRQATLLMSLGSSVCSALQTAFRISDFRDRADRANVAVAGSAVVDPGGLYPAYNISVPIDHFHNDSSYEPHSNGTFGLRYWFDASHYREGGPVIVVAGGETSGDDRLPFMQKGILALLSKATGGMGVILEHRYYGASFPVPDLSTENLRFLTTDQALADTAYFARNVVFKGFEDRNLTSHRTAYIAYGGSYAGAFVAFLRKLYPDVYWGAISSSGVTLAVWDYWQYYEAHRLYAPPECVVTTQKLTHVVDNIALDGSQPVATRRLKEVFGLGNVTHLADFADVLSCGMARWQNLNWDPAKSDDETYRYCANITSDELIYPATEGLTSTVRDLLDRGGYGDEKGQLANRMLNYIGYINLTRVAGCARQNRTQDDCFSNLKSDFYARDDISQDWRSWPYQVCTQWGYLQSGSGVPRTQLPLVSRLLDLEYLSFVCRAAFNITEPADAEAINKHGGVSFSYPRVALIDGEADPWLAAGTHTPGAPERKSTLSEPFILIGGGAVHHWDENGLFPNETTESLPPMEIREVQRKEVEFVVAWMAEWQAERSGGQLNGQFAMAN